MYDVFHNILPECNENIATAMKSSEYSCDIVKYSVLCEL